MSRDTPQHLIVMGVSGVGKTTIAAGLVDRLGWEFAEGDAFHSEESRAKMSAGFPLTDEDRLPWLRRLSDWIADRHARHLHTVMTCSALKRHYRDILREAAAADTAFVHLVGDKGLLLERMGSREHYMPPELLESQLDALEPLQPDERGVVIDVAPTPEQVVDMAITELGLPVSGR